MLQTLKLISENRKTVKMKLWYDQLLMITKSRNNDLAERFKIGFLTDLIFNDVFVNFGCRDVVLNL